MSFTEDSPWVQRVNEAPDYLAPEIFRATEEVTEAVDWWALGIIL